MQVAQLQNAGRNSLDGLFLSELGHYKFLYGQGLSFIYVFEWEYRLYNIEYKRTIIKYKSHIKKKSVIIGFRKCFYLEKMFYVIHFIVKKINATPLKNSKYTLKIQASIDNQHTKPSFTKNCTI